MAGHSLRIAQHGFETRRQFLPARILTLRAGQRIQPALLDAVHQLAWFALRRDKVIPAARDVRLLVQTQDAASNRIAMMVVVTQPAVETGFAQGSLNRL